MSTPKRYPDRAAKQRAYRQRVALARQQEQAAKGLPPAPAVATIPGARRWRALLAHARSALTTLRDEMELYYTERTETWQESEPGEACQERLQSLNDLLESVEELQP